MPEKSRPLVKRRKSNFSKRPNTAFAENGRGEWTTKKSDQDISAWPGNTYPQGHGQYASMVIVSPALFPPCRELTLYSPLNLPGSLVSRSVNSLAGAGLIHRLRLLQLIHYSCIAFSLRPTVSIVAAGTRNVGFRTCTSDSHAGRRSSDCSFSFQISHYLWTRAVAALVSSHTKVDPVLKPAAASKISIPFCAQGADLPYVC